MLGPNITGSVWSIAGTSGNGIEGGAEGSLYASNRSNSDVTTGQTGSSSASDCINMDASKTSSIFGFSNTVQPPSIYTLIIIKV